MDMEYDNLDFTLKLSESDTDNDDDGELPPGNPSPDQGRTGPLIAHVGELPVTSDHSSPDHHRVRISTSITKNTKEEASFPTEQPDSAINANELPVTSDKPSPDDGVRIGPSIAKNTKEEASCSAEEPPLPEALMPEATRMNEYGLIVPLVDPLLPLRYLNPCSQQDDDIWGFQQSPSASPIHRNTSSDSPSLLDVSLPFPEEMEGIDEPSPPSKYLVFVSDNSDSGDETEDPSQVCFK